MLNPILLPHVRLQICPLIQHAYNASVVGHTDAAREFLVQALHEIEQIEQSSVALDRSDSNPQTQTH